MRMGALSLKRHETQALRADINIRYHYLRIKIVTAKEALSTRLSTRNKLSTQAVTRFHALALNKKAAGLALVTLLSACSFVELHPNAGNVILTNDASHCEKLEEFVAETSTTNFFIERAERGVAEDLQTLAQNRAHELFGNAIWPESDIENGSRRYSIFRCKSR